jgi:DNA-binding NtrC family response regulator
MPKMAVKSSVELATLIGASPAVVTIRREIDQIADSAASVLITGPSGSGKDVAAQLLHQKSRRAGAPYIALNCAAVTPDLLESEMFGHEAGAFTGATRARIGRFEAAHSGSLFLDEVGDMPLAMQAKLLRALETRVVERVGGMIPVACDVRLIAATSVDLHAAIDRGLFRSDLLYRLDVIRIEMPPLADRPQDIPLLIDHFCRSAGAPPIRFDAGAMALLMDHPWAGNVRELKNFVERARAHHPGEVINRDALPRLLRPRAGNAMRTTETANEAAVVCNAKGTPPMTLPQVGPGHGVDLRQLLADLEQAYIRAALSACGGTIAGSARLLGLQRTTLIEKMRRLQITPGT